MTDFAVRRCKTVLTFLFTFYLIFLFWILLIGRTPSDVYGVNLQPFYTLRHYCSGLESGYYGWRTVMMNMAGNIILLMPLTFCLPILLRSMRRWWLCLPIAALLDAFFELAQYMTHRGACDVDDVIVNMAGAIVAYPFGCLCARWLRHGKNTGNNSVLQEGKNTV